MITVIAWVLLLIVSLILILAITVLLWTPLRSVKEKTTDSSSLSNNSSLNREKQEAHAVLMERYLHDIRICWPGLEIMLDAIELNDTLLLHWKGLHGEKKVLFSITEEQAGKSLLEAVSDLNDSSLIPDIDFYISLPLTDDPEQISVEILQWAHGNRIQFDFVLCNDDGLRTMPGLKGMQALIGTGTRASVLYKVQGDTPEADWMASLKAGKLMEPKWNEQAAGMYSSVHRLLPWQLRFESCFSFLFRKKLMKDLMTLLPDTRSWFLPQIDKRGDSLYLSACDNEILSEAENRVENSARNHQIRLKKIHENRVRMTADPDSDSYRLVSEACRKSLDVSAVIPVLREYTEKEEEDYLPSETLSFSPVLSGRRVSFHGALSFYENILRKRSISPQ